MTIHHTERDHLHQLQLSLNRHINQRLIGLLDNVDKSSNMPDKSIQEYKTYEQLKELQADKNRKFDKE